MGTAFALCITRCLLRGGGGPADTGGGSGTAGACFDDRDEARSAGALQAPLPPVQSTHLSAFQARVIPLQSSLSPLCSHRNPLRLFEAQGSPPRSPRAKISNDWTWRALLTQGVVNPLGAPIAGLLAEHAFGYQAAHVAVEQLSPAVRAEFNAIAKS
eukprot:SAG11_NODE_4157_length_2034_cov_1.830491_2_plen_157_part_00